MFTHYFINNLKNMKNGYANSLKKNGRNSQSEKKFYGMFIACETP